MATMKAPEGVTQVSVETQVFEVNEGRMVKVPDLFVAKLKEIGFKEVAERISVSKEAAADIAAAAAKLGLPDPALTKTVDQGQKSPEPIKQLAAPQRPQVVSRPSILPADNNPPKEGETKSTEPSGAAPGALVLHPEAGATGNGSTIDNAQLKEAGV